MSEQADDQKSNDAEDTTVEGGGSGAADGNKAPRMGKKKGFKHDLELPPFPKAVPLELSPTITQLIATNEGRFLQLKRDWEALQASKKEILLQQQRLADKEERGNS